MDMDMDTKIKGQNIISGNLSNTTDIKKNNVLCLKFGPVYGYATRLVELA